MSFVFDWRNPRLSLAMPGFIALSLLLHAVAFYIFQVATPPGFPVKAPPAHVTLLSPSNPQTRAFMKWVESEDPALVHRPSPYIPPALLKSTYRPSFDQARSLPPLYDDQENELRALPPGIDFQSLLQRSPHNPGSTPTAPAPSQLVFSSIFNHPPVRLKVTPTTFKDLAPIRFLVGVSPQGTATYVLKQGSSGDTAMDAQAERQLISMAFPATGKQFIWGQVTVAWGSDAFTDKRP